MQNSNFARASLLFLYFSLNEEVRWNSCDKRLKERKFPF